MKKRIRKRYFIIPLVLLALSAAIVFFVTAKTEIDTVYPCFKLSIDDADYAVPCEVYAVGTYKRKITSAYNTFTGRITLPEPYKSELEKADMLDLNIIPYESRILWYNMYNPMTYKIETYFPCEVNIRGKFDDFVILTRDLIKNDIGSLTGEIIIGPAETADEARGILSEYLEDENYKSLNEKIEYYKYLQSR